MNNPNQPSDLSVETAAQLHRSALRLLRLIREARPGKALNPSQLGVLGRLYREGEATATELADYLRVRPQSLTRLLTDLKDRNLISHQRSPEDRRRNLLAITDSGIDLLMEEIGDQRLNLAVTIDRELSPTEQGLLGLAAGLIDRIAAAAEVSGDD